MSGVKLFRREDQDFSFKGDSSVNQEPYSILALANACNSDSLGGGLGDLFVVRDAVTFKVMGCMGEMIGDSRPFAFCPNENQAVKNFQLYIMQAQLRTVGARKIFFLWNRHERAIKAIGPAMIWATNHAAACSGTLENP